jgi:hypothetical protein
VPPRDPVIGTALSLPSVGAIATTGMLSCFNNILEIKSENKSAAVRLKILCPTLDVGGDANEMKTYYISLANMVSLAVTAKF